MGELQEIIESAGFKDVVLIPGEVTDEYAMKWGHGLDIKNYIQSTTLIGRKPGERQ